MVTFSQQTTAPTSASTPASASARGGSKGGNKMLPLVVVVAVIAVIAGGYWFFRGRGGGAVGSDYQAVFLTNGRTYYGKVASSSSSEVVLRDIYYMVATQPAPDAEATPGAQNVQYTLVKLGEEMRGPMDEMRINREHILYIESLKEGGKVVQAIKQYKASLEGQPKE